jgi:hypothetical protein
MSEIEKQVEEFLKVVPLRTREILRLLSRRNCRSEIQELVWLIEARGAGRLRDIGDATVTRLIPLDQIPEIHQAEKIQAQTQSSEFESPHL